VAAVGEFAALELPFFSRNDFIDHLWKDSEAVNNIFVRGFSNTERSS
jgi:hypothetical protein